MAQKAHRYYGKAVFKSVQTLFFLFFCSSYNPLPFPFYPAMSLATSWIKWCMSSREECEKSCDVSYERDADFCRAMSGMR